MLAAAREIAEDGTFAVLAQSPRSPLNPIFS
jgi:hypothetical protein